MAREPIFRGKKKEGFERKSFMAGMAFAAVLAVLLFWLPEVPGMLKDGGGGKDGAKTEQEAASPSAARDGGNDADGTDGSDAAEGERQEPEKLSSSVRGITGDGDVMLELAAADAEKAGWTGGDTASVSFGDGKHFGGVPVEAGYDPSVKKALFLPEGGNALLAVPGNAKEDEWPAGLEFTAEIEQMAPEKTDDGGDGEGSVQSELGPYSPDREDYSSDEEFANWREVTAGGIRPGRLYRSASPYCNQCGRAPYVASLAQDAGIRALLDLADAEGGVPGEYREPPEWGIKLAESGGVAYAKMEGWGSAKAGKSLAEGLSSIKDMDGPWLVACIEGKDRTGFACAVLEALCGASYEEIRADYMASFEAYWGKEAVELLEDRLAEEGVDAMLSEITSGRFGREDGIDLADSAGQWLRRMGMPEEDVSVLKARLTGN